MSTNMEKERLIISGKREEVIASLREQAGMDEAYAEKWLDFLESDPSVLGDDEKFEQSLCMEEIEEGGDGGGFSLGLMMPKYNYYINIKAATVFLLSLIIDNKISFPAVSLGLAVRGMNRLVQKIEEDSGGKCILLELWRQPEKTGRADLLDRFKGECCNNHLSCRFRNEGECRCTCEDAAEILEKLADEGILIRKGDTYRYDMIGSL